MITALSVQFPKKSEGIKRYLNKLRRDRVEVEIDSARGVAVKHITYTSFSGELRLDKTREAIGSQRDRLLCSERIIFPHRSGFRRFSSTSFSARLCTNLALKVLSMLKNPEELHLGIYDPEAVATDFLLKALPYCRIPKVVTENIMSYSLAAKRALDEQGAAVFLCKSTDELKDCDLVVAPTRLFEPLPVKESCVVLCVGGGAGENCYGKYSFKMPNGFEKLKPTELDEEYFCSALYILGAQYELGSIVPLSASNKSRSQTAASLAEYYNEMRHVE